MENYFRINHCTTLCICSGRSRISRMRMPTSRSTSTLYFTKISLKLEKFLSWGHASGVITRNYLSFCFEIIIQKWSIRYWLLCSLATLSLVNGFRCVMEYMYCGFSE